MNQLKDFFQWILDAVKIWVIVQPWQTALIVRNGSKIKKVSKGIFFRIPYFDSVYVQESRLRIASMPIQTCTSKDFKTVTINASLGYSITCIETLYNTLYHPEITITNMAMSEVAEFVFENDIKDISPKIIEVKVLEKLNAGNYGLKFEYFRLTSFAIVSTYRLIQDQSWIAEGLNMSEKK